MFSNTLTSVGRASVTGGTGNVCCRFFFNRRIIWISQFRVDAIER